MGAEGPHADHKTAMAICIEGFCSWTIMQRPRTARDTKEHIRHLGWERLDHPAYRPDLAPSDRSSPFSCIEVSTVVTSLPKQ
ncbi:hypothetical protein AVEN_5699-1 [Araneus ventricosus]|uniref:Tc1-like transposase DDE domain-containing protein n=1 Tax=Araneus ventricosus TaxID=182803 RepID=A0A4Y2DTK1_ARAVE|nr:hypothetical protein AVEN_5699-1 [Araneus ventricosus]